MASWLMHGAVPREAIRRTYAFFKRKCSFLSVTVWQRAKSHMAMQPETACPITVAKAAPAIPQWKTNTNRASKTVLTTAPARLQSMVYFGLPSARIRCPPPVAKIKKGKPKETIRVYVFAYGSTSSGEPKKRSIGSRPNWVSRHKMTPQPKSRAAAFPR